VNSDHGIDTRFAYITGKKPRTTVKGGQLVGVSMKGKKVLVVDDVITAGTAIRESNDMLKSIGAEMIGVVIALHRAEKRSSLDNHVNTSKLFLYVTFQPCL
jgi:orotate phosphoribosyltransferase